MVRRLRAVALAGMLAGMLLGSLLALDVHAQGPAAAQIQRAISALIAGSNTWGGTQTFGAVTISGACTGCGGFFAQGANHNAAALASTVYLANGATAQEFDIYGADGGATSNSYLLSVVPAVGETGVTRITTKRGDALGVKISLGLQSQGDGGVLLGNTGAIGLAVFSTTTAIGSKGTNIRSDAKYGFSNTVSGPDVDTIVAGFTYGGSSALIKVTDGTSGYGTLDALGLKASGTAGASCTLTVIAHLTVVNGIVTLCN